MLLIEHDMPLVMSVSDRVYCLEAGVVIAEGTPAEVRNDQLLIVVRPGHRRSPASLIRALAPEVTFCWSTRCSTMSTSAARRISLASGWRGRRRGLVPRRIRAMGACHWMLADVAGAKCMHRGDTASLSFVATTFRGVVVGVGTDIACLAVADGRVDVALGSEATFVLRVGLLVVGGGGRGQRR